LLVSCSLAACVESPRSESSLPQKSAPLHVSGLFEVPDVDLQVQVYDHRQGTWQRFATTRTRAESPVVDSAGHPYFHYATDVVLPQAPAFWAPLLAASRVEARVRVVYGERVLSTFGSDAESCARG